MNSAGLRRSSARRQAPLALAAMLGCGICSCMLSSPAVPDDDGRWRDGGGRFAWPLRGVLFSGFGMRNGRLHAGLDISAPEGRAIRAAAGGLVTYSGDRVRGYGNMVLVDHGDGYVTAYAHNRDNLAVVGQRVRRGEVIATVGATGNATGPHVHFEVRWRGKTVNPRPFLGR